MHLLKKHKTANMKMTVYIEYCMYYVHATVSNDSYNSLTIFIIYKPDEFSI